MAIVSDVTAGTVNVSGKTVTGVGTSFDASRFREGDIFIAAGYFAIVASVASNTSLHLVDWAGPDLVDAPYRLRYQSDGSRASAQSRNLVELLGNSGTLQSLTALIGMPDTVPIFTGPGTMTLKPVGEIVGVGLRPRGVWDAGVTYARGEMISHGTRSFASIAGGNAGNQPPNDDVSDEVWMYIPAPQGPDGEPGLPGADGREVDLQASTTHVQWRYAGDTDWIDLVLLADLRGADGSDGADGLDGSNGADGIDGREIELQSTSAYIQWRYAGDAWADLISRADLKGDKGDIGASFSPDATGLLVDRGDFDSEAEGFSYLATDVGDLYFRQGASGWSDGAPFGKGEPGEKGQDGAPGLPGAPGTDGNDGADGREVELQTSETHVQWRHVGDVTWANLILLTDITGAKGEDGVPGTTNYLDLENRPTLGTAAALDVGTEPSNVVQLDVDGKLPAVDGSQLTGVATAVPEVLQPSNITPADGATDLAIDRAAITLTASGYYSLYGKPHVASQWQVSTSSGFGTTVYDQTDASAVTSHAVPASTLPVNSTFYWRSRYKDADGTWSKWSASTNFTTANVFINTPILVSPADAAIGMEAKPTLVASVFAVTNGTDAHASSDWEVRLVSDDSLVWTSADNAASKTSIAVPTGNLVVSTEYKWRVRFAGAKYGLSLWSDYRRFTTAPSFDLVLGDSFGGGYYIGNIDDGGTIYALILAPKSSGQNNSLMWKTTNTATIGTSSRTNGPANLAGMVAAGIALHPAGQFCKNLTIGGFTDWYLPADGELNVIYTNRAVIGGGDAIDVDATWCWSSFENSAANARVQKFSDGGITNFGKDSSHRVRAVRRVEI